MFCYFQLPTYMKSQDRFNVSFWFCSAQSLESSLNLLFQIKMMVIFTIFLTSYGEGNGNPLQYSCLENPMDRGAWWATVHGVAKSRTRLSDFSSLLLHLLLTIWWNSRSGTGMNQIIWRGGLSSRQCTVFQRSTHTLFFFLSYTFLC